MLEAFSNIHKQPISSKKKEKTPQASSPFKVSAQGTN